METTTLQGIGRVPAIKAEDLKVGMKQVFNYGNKEEVVSIESKGKASLSITTRNDKGNLYTWTRRRSSLVVVAA